MMCLETSLQHNSIAVYGVQHVRCLQYQTVSNPPTENCDTMLLSARLAAQELGADETVDYTKEDFSAKYKDKPFDVIMDSVGGAAPVKDAWLCCYQRSLALALHANPYFSTQWIPQ